VSLPKIMIGVFEQDWHGVPVLKSLNSHLISIEDVALGMGIPVEDLCAAIGPPLQRLRAAGPEARAMAERRIRDAAPLFRKEAP